MRYQLEYENIWEHYNTHSNINININIDRKPSIKPLYNIIIILEQSQPIHILYPHPPLSSILFYVNRRGIHPMPKAERSERVLPILLKWIRRIHASEASRIKYTKDRSHPSKGLTYLRQVSRGFVCSLRSTILFHTRYASQPSIISHTIKIYDI